PPPPDQAPPCSEAGVLGIVPGLVGMFQALEVFKLILGFGDTLQGKLMLIDARSSRVRQLALSVDPDCAYCAPDRPVPGGIDYEGFCSGVAEHAGTGSGSHCRRRAGGG